MSSQAAFPPPCSAPPKRPLRTAAARRVAMGLSLLALAAGATAQTPPAPAAAGTSSAEPVVVRTVIEDDGARIEELRVRGEVQRITVRSKAGGAPYEVLPATGARDPSQGMAGTGQTAGRRVWNLLSF